MNLHQLLDSVAQFLGWSIESAALVCGILIGLVVAKLFGKRVLPQTSGLPQGLSGGASHSSIINQPAAGNSSVVISSSASNISLTSAQISEIGQLLSQNKKIEAIKKLREYTALDLAHAKGLIDSWNNIPFK